MNLMFNWRMPVLLVLCIFAGFASVIFSTMVDGNALLSFALPIVMIMMLLLFIDKKKLFFYVILLRSSCDILFQSAKFDSGIGIGGLINGFVILIAILCIIEKPKIFTRQVVSMWLGLLLISLFSLLYAPDFRDSIKMFLAIVSYFAVFVIAFYVVRSSEDFKYAVRIILLSSVIPFVYAFVDIFLNINNASSDGFRLKSTFSHANIFAFYLVIIISLLLYQLKGTRSKFIPITKFTLYTYLLLLMILLVMTKTRSAWAACIIIFSVYGFMFERRILVYLLILPVIALLVPDIRDRIADLGSGNEYVQYAKLNSFAWRLLLWESSIEWIEPIKTIFGYGLNSYKYYSPYFFPLAGDTKFGAHSTYVQWFFEAGIIGILTASWLYLRILTILSKNPAVSRVGSVIFVTLVVEYLIFSFSDNTIDYLSFNWYFWLLIGSACSLALSTDCKLISHYQSMSDIK